MVYNFSDIYNDTLYKNSRIIFITGKYNIFNNIVVDKFKDVSKGDILVDGLDSDIFEEFGLSDISTDKVSNNIDIDTFFTTSNAAPVSGKWISIVDYNALTKTQKNKLGVYMKSPSENGILVIRLSDYKDFKEYLRNKIILNSSNINLIKLSFPSKSTLKEILYNKFISCNIDVSYKALDLFIMRLSSNYDTYDDVINSIVNNLGSMQSKNKIQLSYKDMLEYLKGVQFYILDDFILQLLIPIKTKKIVTNRKIYKIEKEMLNELGAKGLVNKLRYRVDDLIEMRMAINNGYIPIRVKYSVQESKRRLGESSKLNKLSDYSFKYTAYIASKTSLKDWLFIKMLLNNIENISNIEEYERVIHSIVNRSTFNENRLLNDIGVIDTIENSLYELNNTKVRI